MRRWRSSVLTYLAVIAAGGAVGTLVCLVLFVLFAAFSPGLSWQAAGSGIRNGLLVAGITLGFVVIATCPLAPTLLRRTSWFVALAGLGPFAGWLVVAAVSPSAFTPIVTVVFYSLLALCVGIASSSIAALCMFVVNTESAWRRPRADAGAATPQRR